MPSSLRIIKKATPWRNNLGTNTGSTSDRVVFLARFIINWIGHHDTCQTGQRDQSALVPGGDCAPASRQPWCFLRTPCDPKAQSPWLAFLVGFSGGYPHFGSGIAWLFRGYLVYGLSASEVEEIFDVRI